MFGEKIILQANTIDEFLVDNRDASFMLKVKGNSMQNAGILDGDMVIVERAYEAKNGSIVIAEQDGDWVMRYLYKDGTNVYLHNGTDLDQGSPVVKDLKISAIVRSVIRKY